MPRSPACKGSGTASLILEGCPSATGLLAAPGMKVMALFEARNVIADAINIKILNAGAWARTSERVSVTLPMELEDYIPQVEEFYRSKHSGRKLQWHHLMSNGIVSNVPSSFSFVFFLLLSSSLVGCAMGLC